MIPHSKLSGKRAVLQTPSGPFTTGHRDFGLIHAEKEQFPAELVKAQLSSVTTVAVSLTIDDAAHNRAKSHGAMVLLDKLRLYTDLIPAIRQGPDSQDNSLFEMDNKFLEGFRLPN